MNKVYNTAVVIIPPENIWGSIQKIRRKFDRHIDRWMPHITMLYPFYPQSEFSWVIKKFSEIKRIFFSFEIMFEKLDYFHHKKENFTLWLKPEPSDKIIELQKKLLEYVPECDDVSKFKTGFTPHLSLGQIKGKPNLHSVKKKLEYNWKPLSFIVKYIALIWRNKENPRDPFKVIEKVSLI